MLEILNTPISLITTPNQPHTPTTAFRAAHRSATPAISADNSLFKSTSLPQSDLDTCGNAKPQSVSPALLDCSFDSGIGVESNDMELRRKLKDYKRILALLERDKEMYRLLRERLSKLIDRKHKKHQQQPKDVGCCNVCGAANAAGDASSAVLCSICQKSVCCNTKCVQWQHIHARWECQLCSTPKQSLAHTKSWLNDQMLFNEHKFNPPSIHPTARSEIYIPITEQNDSHSMVFESVSQADDGADSNTTVPIGAKETRSIISNEQKLKIREYVEAVVAQMLGGSLDSVAVGQISKSENYLLLFRKYHSKLSNLLINLENALNDAALLKRDLPKLVNGNHELNSNNTHNNNHSSNGTTFIDLSQTRLRQLIDAIIAEAVRLPLTLSSTAASEVAFDTQSNSGNPLAQIKANGDAKSIKNHRTEHYFEPKIYQELLATAVLNRIADIHGNVRPLSGSSADFSAPDANQNFKDDRSSSSGSSVGPRSDLSFTDNDHILNLNLGDDFGSRPSLRSDVITKLQLDAGRESALSDYVAAHTIPLPDLSAPATESEEDDYTSIASSQIGDGNWENNWLLKKRKSSLSSTVTAGSVGMLVPAPKDDVRAQIGDKIADETSDLSEMGSDTDDSSLELMHGQLDPLNDRLLNKHLIGGKNTKLVLDELIDQSSMVSGTSPAEHEPICTDTTNAHVCQEATKTEAINDAFAMTLLESSPRTSNSIASPSETIIHQPLRHYDDNGNRKSNLEVDAENPITAPLNIIEVILDTDGCIGFSTDVEVFDSDLDAAQTESCDISKSPSVVEILAAMTLGPMLAIPASEEKSVLSPSEMVALKELSDLALEEIKARDLSSTHHILGVIEEETLEDNFVRSNTTEDEKPETPTADQTAEMAQTDSVTSLVTEPHKSVEMQLIAATEIANKQIDLKIKLVRDQTVRKMETWEFDSTPPSSDIEEVEIELASQTDEKLKSVPNFQLKDSITSNKIAEDRNRTPQTDDNGKSDMEKSTLPADITEKIEATSQDHQEPEPAQPNSTIAPPRSEKGKPTALKVTEEDVLTTAQADHKADGQHIDSAMPPLNESSKSEVEQPAAAAEIVETEDPTSQTDQNLDFAPPDLPSPSPKPEGEESTASLGTAEDTKAGIQPGDKTDSQQPHSAIASANESSKSQMKKSIAAAEIVEKADPTPQAGQKVDSVPLNSSTTPPKSEGEEPSISVETAEDAKAKMQAMPSYNESSKSGVNYVSPAEIADKSDLTPQACQEMDSAALISQTTSSKSEVDEPNAPEETVEYGQSTAQGNQELDAEFKKDPALQDYKELQFAPLDLAPTLPKSVGEETTVPKETAENAQTRVQVEHKTDAQELDLAMPPLNEYPTSEVERHDAPAEIAKIDNPTSQGDQDLDSAPLDSLPPSSKPEGEESTTLAETAEDKKAGMQADDEADCQLHSAIPPASETSNSEVKERIASAEIVEKANPSPQAGQELEQKPNALEETAEDSQTRAQIDYVSNDEIEAEPASQVDKILPFTPLDSETTPPKSEGEEPTASKEIPEDAQTGMQACGQQAGTQELDTAIPPVNESTKSEVKQHDSSAEIAEINDSISQADRDLISPPLDLPSPPNPEGEESSASVETAEDAKAGLQADAEILEKDDPTPQVDQDLDSASLDLPSPPPKPEGEESTTSEENAQDAKTGMPSDDKADCQQLHSGIHPATETYNSEAEERIASAEIVEKADPTPQASQKIDSVPLNLSTTPPKSEGEELTISVETAEDAKVRMPADKADDQLYSAMPSNNESSKSEINLVSPAEIADKSDLTPQSCQGEGSAPLISQATSSKSEEKESNVPEETMEYAQSTAQVVREPDAEFEALEVNKELQLVPLDLAHTLPKSEEDETTAPKETAEDGQTGVQVDHKTDAKDIDLAMPPVNEHPKSEVEQHDASAEITEIDYLTSQGDQDLDSTLLDSPSPPPKTEEQESVEDEKAVMQPDNETDCQHLYSAIHPATETSNSEAEECIESAEIVEKADPTPQAGQKGDCESLISPTTPFKSEGEEPNASEKTAEDSQTSAQTDHMPDAEIESEPALQVYQILHLAPLDSATTPPKPEGEEPAAPKEVPEDAQTEMQADRKAGTQELDTAIPPVNESSKSKVTQHDASGEILEINDSISQADRDLITAPIDLPSPPNPEGEESSASVKTAEDAKAGLQADAKIIEKDDPTPQVDQDLDSEPLDLPSPPNPEGEESSASVETAKDANAGLQAEAVIIEKHDPTSQGDQDLDSAPLDLPSPPPKPEGEETTTSEENAEDAKAGMQSDDKADCQQLHSTIPSPTETSNSETEERIASAEIVKKADPAPEASHKVDSALLISPTTPPKSETEEPNAPEETGKQAVFKADAQEQDSDMTPVNEYPKSQAQQHYASADIIKIDDATSQADRDLDFSPIDSPSSPPKPERQESATLVETAENVNDDKADPQQLHSAIPSANELSKSETEERTESAEIIEKSDATSQAGQEIDCASFISPTIPSKSEHKEPYVSEETAEYEKTIAQIDHKPDAEIEAESALEVDKNLQLVTLDSASGSPLPKGEEPLAPKEIAEDVRKGTQADHTANTQNLDTAMPLVIESSKSEVEQYDRTTEIAEIDNLTPQAEKDLDSVPLDSPSSPLKLEGEKSATSVETTEVAKAGMQANNVADSQQLHSVTPPATKSASSEADERISSAEIVEKAVPTLQDCHEVDSAPLISPTTPKSESEEPDAEETKMQAALKADAQELDSAMTLINKHLKSESKQHDASADIAGINDPTSQADYDLDSAPLDSPSSPSKREGEESTTSVETTEDAKAGIQANDMADSQHSAIPTATETSNSEAEKCNPSAEIVEKADPIPQAVQDLDSAPIISPTIPSKAEGEEPNAPEEAAESAQTRAQVDYKPDAENEEERALQVDKLQLTSPDSATTPLKSEEEEEPSAPKEIAEDAQTDMQADHKACAQELDTAMPSVNESSISEVEQHAACAEIVKFDDPTSHAGPNLYSAPLDSPTAPLKLEGEESTLSAETVEDGKAGMQANDMADTQKLDTAMPLVIKSSKSEVEKYDRSAEISEIDNPSSQAEKDLDSAPLDSPSSLKLEGETSTTSVETTEDAKAGLQADAEIVEKDDPTPQVHHDLDSAPLDLPSPPPKPEGEESTTSEENAEDAKGGMPSDDKADCQQLHSGIPPATETSNPKAEERIASAKIVEKADPTLQPGQELDCAPLTSPTIPSNSEGEEPFAPEETAEDAQAEAQVDPKPDGEVEAEPALPIDSKLQFAPVDSATASPKSGEEPTAPKEIADIVSAEILQIDDPTTPADLFSAPLYSPSPLPKPAREEFSTSMKTVENAKVGMQADVETVENVDPTPQIGQKIDFALIISPTTHPKSEEEEPTAPQETTEDAQTTERVSQKTDAEIESDPALQVDKGLQLAPIDSATIPSKSEGEEPTAPNETAWDAQTELKTDHRADAYELDSATLIPSVKESSKLDLEQHSGAAEIVKINDPTLQANHNLNAAPLDSPTLLPKPEDSTTSVETVENAKAEMQADDKADSQRLHSAIPSANKPTKSEVENLIKSTEIFEKADPRPQSGQQAFSAPLDSLTTPPKSEREEANVPEENAEHTHTTALVDHKPDAEIKADPTLQVDKELQLAPLDTEPASQTAMLSDYRTSAEQLDSSMTEIVKIDDSALHADPSLNSAPLDSPTPPSKPEEESKGEEEIIEKTDSERQADHEVDSAPLDSQTTHKLKGEKPNAQEEIAGEAQTTVRVNHKPDVEIQADPALQVDKEPQLTPLDLVPISPKSEEEEPSAPKETAEDAQTGMEGDHKGDAQQQLPVNETFKSEVKQHDASAEIAELNDPTSQANKDLDSAPLDLLSSPPKSGEKSTISVETAEDVKAGMQADAEIVEKAHPTPQAAPEVDSAPLFSSTTPPKSEKGEPNVPEEKGMQADHETDAGELDPSMLPVNEPSKLEVRQIDDQTTQAAENLDSAPLDLTTDSSKSEEETTLLTRTAGIAQTAPLCDHRADAQELHLSMTAVNGSSNSKVEQHAASLEIVEIYNPTSQVDQNLEAQNIESSLDSKSLPPKPEGEESTTTVEAAEYAKTGTPADDKADSQQPHSAIFPAKEHSKSEEEKADPTAKADQKKDSAPLDSPTIPPKSEGEEPTTSVENAADAKARIKADDKADVQQLYSAMPASNESSNSEDWQANKSLESASLDSTTDQSKSEEMEATVATNSAVVPQTTTTTSDHRADAQDLDSAITSEQVKQHAAYAETVEQDDATSPPGQKLDFVPLDSPANPSMSEVEEPNAPEEPAEGARIIAQVNHQPDAEFKEKDERKTQADHELQPLNSATFPPKAKGEEPTSPKKTAEDVQTAKQADKADALHSSTLPANELSTSVAERPTTAAIIAPQRLEPEQQGSASLPVITLPMSGLESTTKRPPVAETTTQSDQKAGASEPSQSQVEKLTEPPEIEVEECSGNVLKIESKRNSLKDDLVEFSEPEVPEVEKPQPEKDYKAMNTLTGDSQCEFVSAEGLEQALETKEPEIIPTPLVKLAERILQETAMPTSISKSDQIKLQISESESKTTQQRNVSHPEDIGGVVAAVQSTSQNENATIETENSSSAQIAETQHPLTEILTSPNDANCVILQDHSMLSAVIKTEVKITDGSDQANEEVWPTNMHLSHDELVLSSTVLENQIESLAISKTENLTPQTDQSHSTERTGSENCITAACCKDSIVESQPEDQLSSDSNYTDESAVTAVENFADDRRGSQSVQASTMCDETNSAPSYNLSVDPVDLVTNNHCCQTKNTISTVNTNISTNHYIITNGSISGAQRLAACSEEPLSAVDEEKEKEHVDNNFALRRFLPGSIAEREYKKWYNAVDMPNNPYSPEALQRRISGSQEKYIDLPNISPSTELNPISMIETGLENEVVQEEQMQEREYKRYSRDYYINGNKTLATNVKPKTLPVGRHQDNDGDGDGDGDDDDACNEGEEVANKIAKIVPQENIYQAIPAQVVEDPASLEIQSTLSNQSMQSLQSVTATTTSDDSDTIRIYDFKKQETTTIRETTRPNASPNPAATENRSVKSTNEILQESRQRPTELPISRHTDNITTAITAATTIMSPSPAITSSRGSTPTAFKFLQPKRKLIDPSQVLSFDEEDVPQFTPVERSPIEDEVANALPSVKALAQAFLMTSHKCPQISTKRRWPLKAKTPEPIKNPPTPVAPAKILEPAPSLAEIADDATIASDLSSLETDPLVEHGVTDANVAEALETSASGKTSPAPVRSGFLQSNIAFFENLKFK